MTARASGLRLNYPGFGLGLLMAIVLGFVMLSSLSSNPDRRHNAEPIVSRDIVFSDRADGGITIRDASSGELIGEIEPGEGGFLRGALRGFTRQRRLENPGVAAPLRLAALRDGAIILEDPTSGHWTNLRAFGASNARGFVEILTKKNEEGK